MLLDVLVTDRDGNVILGLGPDGLPGHRGGQGRSRSRRHFLQQPALRSHAQRAVASARRRHRQPAPRSAATSSLFFDDQRERQRRDAPGLLARQLDAGRELAEWLRHELLPNDWVAVRELRHPACGCTRTSPATAKRWSSAVLAAIPRHEAGEELAVAARGARATSRRSRRSLGDGSDAARSDAGRSTAASPCSPRPRRASAGARTSSSSPAASDDHHRIGQYGPDPRYDEPMIEALNAANVAVYAVDVVPPGTRAPRWPTPARTSRTRPAAATVPRRHPLHDAARARGARRPAATTWCPTAPSTRRRLP